VTEQVVGTLHDLYHVSWGPAPMTS